MYNEIDGPIYKSIGWDVYRAGAHIAYLLLRYGNLPAYHSWFDKSLAGWQDKALAESKQYAQEALETGTFLYLFVFQPQPHLRFFTLNGQVFSSWFP